MNGNGDGLEMTPINKLRNQLVKDVIEHYQILERPVLDDDEKLIDSNQVYEIVVYVISESHGVDDIQYNIRLIMDCLSNLDYDEHYAKPTDLQRCANLLQREYFYRLQHSDIQLALNKICVGIYKTWSTDYE